MVIPIQVWENGSNQEGSSCYIPLTSLSFQDFEESLVSRHLPQYLNPQSKQRGQNCSKSFRQFKLFMLEQLKKTIEITCSKIHTLSEKVKGALCLFLNSYFRFYHRTSYLGLELYFAGAQFDSVQVVWFFVIVLILCES